MENFQKHWEETSSRLNQRCFKQIDNKTHNDTNDNDYHNENDNHNDNDNDSKTS